MGDKSVPELSRIVRVGEVTSKGRVLKIDARPDECQALATRFDLPSITLLQAKLSIKDGGRAQGIIIEGHIDAELQQSCALSSMPVDELVDDDFRLRLVGSEELALADSEEYYLDPDADDLELLDGDNFDAGEIVAQSLSLMLTPYPRAEGVSLEAVESAKISVNQEPLKRANPFEILSSLKDKP